MAKKKSCTFKCESFCQAQFGPQGPAMFTCKGCGSRFTIFEESCGCSQAPFKGKPVAPISNRKDWKRRTKRHEDWKQGKFPVNCHWSR